MTYHSTRGQAKAHSFDVMVAAGLAPDGGLFLPDSLPDLSDHFGEWEMLPYPELCAAFFAVFAPEISRRELSAMAERAYAPFEHERYAPLRQLSDDRYVLELFHGPTLAFKDFALRFLGQLYARQIAKTGHGINVLGATSGDTGSAAIHGLLDVPGARVFILYPNGRISPLQERQMACTGAANVFPIAIDGTFDDAQAILKEAFADAAFRTEVRLSAINSINLARILAQSVYYLYAWFQLVRKHPQIEFVVPTGNFGNVMAGWLARQMGMHGTSFCVATNENDILYRFFNTGHYELGTVAPTHAPAMDIQVASNFERFLYYAERESSDRVRAIMADFKAKGSYVKGEIPALGFRASRASNADIERLIGEVYHKYNYVCDPHTACAFAELREEAASVILSTAHPAKFPEVVAGQVGTAPTHPSLEALKQKELVRHKLPGDVGSVKAFIRQHAEGSGT